MADTDQGAMMLIVISYDIEDDQVRTRLANQLKDFGPRVQFSVFEADIHGAELQKLRRLLQRVNLGANDSIRLYQFCEACGKKVEIWGRGEVTQDRDFYIA